MQSKKPNKLFGIVSTVMGCDTAHTYGVIFDVDTQGMITGFTPVDFDGKHVYEWRHNARGVHDPSIAPHTDGDKALLFPITDETAEALLHTIDYVRDDGAKRFRLRAGAPHPNPDFIYYARPSNAEGVVSTTCRDFLMNNLSQIGGVPITDIAADGEVLPAFESSWHVRDFIQNMAGNKGRVCINSLDFKIHHTPQGRLFCAYDGFGDLVTSLNRLPRQEDGRTIAQMLLEDSPPFYDPALVELPKSHVAHAASLASAPVRAEPSQVAAR